MIGIFDSGTGGLSVFKEIRKLMPEERYIYFFGQCTLPVWGKVPGIHYRKIPGNHALSAR